MARGGRVRLRAEPLPQGGAPDTALVIDVLRATTTAPTLLDLGARELLLTADEAGARALRGPGTLLAGERGGLTIPGFDLGNSPLEAQATPLRGKRVVMTTSNGTGAAHLTARTARQVLLGSIVNAPAAARLALALAEEEITLVCAGTGGRVGFDDLYAAGVIVDDLLRLAPDTFDLDDGAWIALTLRRAGPDAHAALAGSRHGQALARLGFGTDIALAARHGQSEAVPQLVRGSGEPAGTLRFVAAPPA